MTQVDWSQIESIYVIGTGIVGALFGGLFTKLADYFFVVKPQASAQLDQTIRKELWERLAVLEDKVGRTEKEVETWRDKYYALQKDYNQLSTDHALLKAELKRITAQMSKNSGVMDDAGIPGGQIGNV